jgi:PPOX class probable F420-dependent enzyme
VPGTPDEELRRSVTDARVARLATLRPNGRPDVVPICFALDGETIYTAVDRKPKRSRRLARIANVRVHPSVEVLVDHYEEDWRRLWWVRLTGRGRVVDPGPEWDRALALLRAKYDQYRAEPPPGPILAIDLDGWVGWHA